MKKVKKLIIISLILSMLKGCNMESVAGTAETVITAIPKITEAISNVQEIIDIVTDGPDTMTCTWLDDLPEYPDGPFTIVNKNIPFFTEADYTKQSCEFYSELDDLGRCGYVMACIGQDIMPTEERGQIGQVKPAGWHTVKYDCITDGMYLYNRCHLIGYQLTGENANEKNLITGTRYMNVEGMLPFENMVTEYVEKTGNHVLYRVTPIYTGGNLIADGVHMEAWSVEDNGKGICFNIFCHNIQPGIIIDYATGDSWEK